MLTVPITTNPDKSLLWDPDPGPSSPGLIVIGTVNIMSPEAAWSLSILMFLLFTMIVYSLSCECHYCVTLQDPTSSLIPYKW